MTTPPSLPNHDADERNFLTRHAAAVRELRERAKACPDPDLLSAAAMGVLPEDVAAGIRTHVASCQLCAALIETFDLNEAADVSPGIFAGADESEAPPLDRIWSRVAPRPKRRWFAWTPGRPWGAMQWAAAAAVIVVVVGIGLVTLRRSAPPPQIVQTPPTLVARALVLPLDKAPLKLPLEALVWRGTPESSSEKYFAELGKALEPYNRNAFAEAQRTLEELEGRYPKSVEAAFYLGVSYLFLERNADALAAFERARQAGPDALKDDVEWYTAVARERQGEMQESRRILEQLCAKEGPYHDSACATAPRMELGTR